MSYSGKIQNRLILRDLIEKNFSPQNQGHSAANIRFWHYWLIVKVLAQLSY